MRAAFEKMEWENKSRTIASFYFRPLGHYRYEPGEYAIFSLPHADTDERGTERTLTLTSTPDQELLSCSMRLHGRGGSSFKRALSALPAGHELTIYDAMGNLTLPLVPDIPLVFVAGGIGIASYVAMTQWLADHGDKRTIDLFYAVRSPEDIVLQDAFDTYRSIGNLTTRLYTPDVNTSHGFKGEVTGRRLSAEEIAAVVRPESQVYLSGPQTMVLSLERDLREYSVSGQQIVFDYFD